MLRDLILKNRSYRRFHGSRAVSRDTLIELVDLARLSPSAANLQPLKYILSWDSVKNGIIFPHLKWAGYLKGWPGPEKGERPSAYIIILGDREVTKKFGCDHGIAAQSIMLGASEKGLGGCIIGSVDRNALRKALGVNDRYEILLVLALGSPREKVIIEKVNEEGRIKYHRDTKKNHYVPKRSIRDIIL